MPEQANVFTGEGNFFTLLEQPNETQRKSYKNENRCLLPNPLTICPREYPGDEQKRAQIIDGTVSVQLVDQDGSELPASKASILDSVEKSLTQPLDDNLSAQFSLKVTETSERNPWRLVAFLCMTEFCRLLFTVNYRVKNLGTVEEKILSRPFIVASNIKKHTSKSSQSRHSLCAQINL